MKNTSYRLVSFMSPSIEDLLYTNNINNDTIGFFKSLIQFCAKMKHIILFIIPNTIEHTFNYSPELKMLKDIITNNSQSNIIFIPLEKKLPCTASDEQINKLILPESVSISSKTLIINNINSRKYPILLNINDSAINKIKCTTCDTDDCLCHEEHELIVSTLPMNDRLSKLARIANTNIDLWHINRSNVTSSDIKALSLLNGLLYGINDEVLEYIDRYGIHEDFINDLKSCPDSNYCNIAFSMLRAIAFPPLCSPDRHKFSIDVHRNNPYKIRGFDYNLLRVDVMAPTRSGASSSGVERLLLAQKDMELTFICYTSEHDFVLPTIKSRLQKLKQ